MSSSFRLMTANVLNGRADPGEIGRILDRRRPDVLLMQEMGPDMADVVAARYPHHDLEPALDHEGHGIASRFEARFGTVPLAWRWIAWARVGLGDRSVVVATTHMRNAVAFPWWKSIRLRGEQVDGLIAWFDREVSDEPFILAGDMNATPVWPVYRRLSGKWDDLVLAEAAVSGQRPAPTWGWRPGWPRILRIDHVFGRGARVTSTVIEPVRGSDHAAIVVDVELEDHSRSKSA
jgi:endonuclease/exonuclease/phosphatase family metal-dependent hydrolase